MKLPRCKVRFKRLYDALGECDFTEVAIDIKRNANPVRTYLHELLHLKHPDWSETRVMNYERKTWKRMTYKQAFALGKRLFNRGFEEAE